MMLAILIAYLRSHGGYANPGDTGAETVCSDENANECWAEGHISIAPSAKCYEFRMPHHTLAIVCDGAQEGTN